MCNDPQKKIKELEAKVLGLDDAKERLEDSNAHLEVENAELKRVIERFRRWTRSRNRALKVIAGFSIFVFVGRGLSSAITAVVQKLRRRQLPTEYEVSHLLAAAFRRIYRASALATLAGVGSVSLLVWQTLEVRETNRHFQAQISSQDTTAYLNRRDVLWRTLFTKGAENPKGADSINIRGRALADLLTLDYAASTDLNVSETFAPKLTLLDELWMDVVGLGGININRARFNNPGGRRWILTSSKSNRLIFNDSTLHELKLTDHVGDFFEAQIPGHIYDFSQDYSAPGVIIDQSTVDTVRVTAMSRSSRFEGMRWESEYEDPIVAPPTIRLQDSRVSELRIFPITGFTLPASNQGSKDQELTDNLVRFSAVRSVVDGAEIGLTSEKSPYLPPGAQMYVSWVQLSLTESSLRDAVIGWIRIPEDGQMVDLGSFYRARGSDEELGPVFGAEGKVKVYACKVHGCDLTGADFTTAQGIQNISFNGNFWDKGSPPKFADDFAGLDPESNGPHKRPEILPYSRAGFSETP